MTEKQKKLAIIVSVIVIGLILLLFSKSSSASNETVVNNSELPPIEVSIPSLNMPPRSPIAINIPGLPTFTPYQYSAISPCMCNGAATSMSQYSGPMVEFVTNQGNMGPNIYNYSAPTYAKPVLVGGFA